MQVQMAREVRGGKVVTVVRRAKTPEERKREEVMKRLADLEKRIEALEKVRQ